MLLKAQPSSPGEHPTLFTLTARTDHGISWCLHFFSYEMGTYSKAPTSQAREEEGSSRVSNPAYHHVCVTERVNWGVSPAKR